MKKIIITILLTAVTLLSSYSQCPIPSTCNYIAVNGTNYTVNIGEILCINSPTNYNSGTITLNGGTVYVANGATLSKDILPTINGSTINICGTLNGNRQFNDKTILNNYSTTNITLDLRNGIVLNNYSTTSNVNLNNMDNTNIKTINNYGVIPSATLTNFNQPLTINNNNGATMTVTSAPTIKTGTIINNNGSGVFNWLPTMVAELGTQINNNNTNSVMNLSTGGSANKPNITNNGTINVSGQFYLAGGVTNNNGTMNFNNELRLDGGTLNINSNSTVNVNTLYKNNGTLNMDDQSKLNIAVNITTWNGTPINLISGCASIYSSTTPSNNAINSPFLNGNPNLNFCGAIPMNGGGCLTSIFTVTDNGIGSFRITGNFSCGVGLNNLQFINIVGVTGVNNDKINGYWRVSKINTTTFDLIGSSYFSGLNITGSQIQFDQSKLMMGFGSTYLGYSNCANPCIPLPISLLTFNAFKQPNNLIEIRWSVINGNNVKFYVIESSTDLIDFTISNIIINNDLTNNEIKNYTTFDYHQHSPTVYYRIKQINNDGSFSYSNIIYIDFNKSDKVLIYPNPSSDNSFIINGFYLNEDTFIRIININGNFNINYECEKIGEDRILISKIVSGTYIVELHTNTTVFYKKVIVY